MLNFEGVQLDATDKKLKKQLWRCLILSKALLKEKLDANIYKLHNVISNILFLRSKHRQIVRPNAQFRNIHFGKRCFILGTGPSLRNVNTNLLKNEIIFGVNFLIRSDVISRITPQYYCLCDPVFHTTQVNGTLEILSALPKTTFFLNIKAYDIIDGLDMDTKNIYYQHYDLAQHSDYIRLDMSKNMTAPFNVVIACIQNAIYMGFEEIYLLGCDFSAFISSKNEHCYDKGDAPDRKELRGFALKQSSLESFYHYALAKYASRNNIRIYNSTPNSFLDAYERKSIEEIT